MNVVMKWRQKEVKLPEEGAKILLNPMERTLYRLFLVYPEGISADCQSRKADLRSEERKDGSDPPELRADSDVR